MFQVRAKTNFRTFPMMILVHVKVKKCELRHTLGQKLVVYLQWGDLCVSHKSPHRWLGLPATTTSGVDMVFEGGLCNTLSTLLRKELPEWPKKC